uniref:C2H2-type domain-containing protein n=1 Tax=Globodera rostochiensis TaxID=31243 RepID=A0A914HKB4_GLORO
MHGERVHFGRHDDDVVNDDLDMEPFIPDWQLIDEISIKLLENGVGTFDTLQRALPSVVLAQIEQILPDDKEKAPAVAGCSGVHLLKLFRLAQLQIDYLLKTQQNMVERLEKAEKRASRYRKENRTLREAFFERGGEERKRHVDIEGKKNMDKNATSAQWGHELFRCNECSKVFLHANFLADHILRKHNAGQLENAAKSSSLRRRLAGTTSPKGTRADDAGESAGGANTAKKLIRRGNSQQEGPKKRYSKKFGLTKQSTNPDYINNEMSSSIGEEILDENRHQKMSSESSLYAWR